MKLYSTSGTVLDYEIKCRSKKHFLSVRSALPEHTTFTMYNIHIMFNNLYIIYTLCLMYNIHNITYYVMLSREDPKLVGQFNYYT